MCTKAIRTKEELRLAKQKTKEMRILMKEGKQKRLSCLAIEMTVTNEYQTAKATTSALEIVIAYKKLPALNAEVV